MKDTPLGTPAVSLGPPPMISLPTEADDLRLLDERGCLTDEVLCFIEQLSADQREAVERHLVDCPACAFHRNQLAEAAGAMRRARPRIPIPSDARLLGRQAVLRGMLKRPRYSEPSDRKTRRRRRLLQIGLVASLALVIVALALLLLTVLSGCKPKSAAKVELKVRFSAGAKLGRLPGDLTAATASAGVFAGGTQRGAVHLLGARGETIVVSAAKARPAKPTSQPASKPAASSKPASKTASKVAAKTASTKPASKPSSRPASPITARHRGAIAALDLSADGELLLSAGGRTVAAWAIDIKAKRATLKNHLRGPQILTAAVLGASDVEAFFGTSQGHVLRWTIASKEAKAMTRFRCRVHMVSPGRAAKPPNRRCPHGTYDTNRKGQGYCAYPVTQLRRQGKTVGLACRDGYAHVLDLKRDRARYRLAGALGDLAFAGKGSLVFGRLDGQLQVYDPSIDDVDASMRPLASFRQPIYAMAASGELLAVAGKTTVTFVHLRGRRPLGALRVTSPPVWVGIELKGPARAGSKGALKVIQRDGQIARYPFVLERAATAKPSQGTEA
jgi:hypothetical protein